MSNSWKVVLIGKFWLWAESDRGLDVKWAGLKGPMNSSRSRSIGRKKCIWFITVGIGVSVLTTYS